MLKVFCSPNTEDIEEYIKGNVLSNNQKNILHIVPTMILTRRRRGFYRRLAPEGDLGVSLYEMDEFVRLLVNKSGQRVLSKTESTVTLERVLKSLDETNNLSWLSMLPTLIDLFRDLSLTGLTQAELSGLANSKRWSDVIYIYSLYIEEVAKHGVSDFGITGFNLLKGNSLNEFDGLLLDGSFLPIMSKHHQLINNFQQSEKPVTLLLPYDLEMPNHPAFRALEKSYSAYLPVAEWQDIQKPRAANFFVDKLPKMIFTEAPPTYLDQTFTLAKFSTVEEELNYIVKEVMELIKNKGVNPRKIAIVTPQFMEMRPIIRELLEQYDVAVTVPPRPLLHLPQGKALKCLYDINIDPRGRGKPYLDLNMVKTILYGQIVATKSPDDTIPNALLEKLSSFLVDCNSFEHWFKVLDDLTRAANDFNMDLYPHHPLAVVSVEELKQLLVLLHNIKGISDDIVACDVMSMDKHVNRLFAMLQNDDRLMQLDEDFIDRLTKITQQMQTQNRLQLGPLEFSARLSAVLVEQEEYELAENTADIIKEIRVTGPGLVEFQRYEYIFICRFTQDMYPEIKRLPWPLNTDIYAKILSATTETKFANGKELDRFLLDHALYQLYSTINSANNLYVTFSQMNEGIELTPAHYLHDIANTFGVQEKNDGISLGAKSLEEILRKVKVLRCPEVIKPKLDYAESVATRIEILPDRTFTVEDVAIYRYCPRRFYYQKMYPKHHVYHNEFQLQSYAAACLYSVAAKKMITAKSERMHEAFEKKRHRSNLLNNANNWVMQAEHELRALFPVSIRAWANVRSRAEFYLQSLIKSIFGHSFLKKCQKKGDASAFIQWSMVSIKDYISIEEFRFINEYDIEISYNNTFRYHLTTSNRKEILFFGSRDARENEEMIPIKDWYFKLKGDFKRREPWAINQLKDFKEQILAGNYPKNAGGQCRYCVFEYLCQERNVSNAHSGTEESD